MIIKWQNVRSNQHLYAIPSVPRQRLGAKERYCTIFCRGDPHPFLCQGRQGRPMCLPFDVKLYNLNWDRYAGNGKHSDLPLHCAFI